MQFCDVYIRLHDSSYIEVSLSGLSNKLQNEGISFLAWEEQVCKMKQITKVALLVLICDDRGMIISQYPRTVQKAKSLSKLLDHDYPNNRQETKPNGELLPNSKIERSIVGIKLENYYVLAVLPQDVFKIHAWNFLDNVKKEIQSQGIQNTVKLLPELFEQGNNPVMTEIDILIADMTANLNNLRGGEQILTEKQVQELEITSARFKSANKKQCRLS